MPCGLWQFIVVDEGQDLPDFAWRVIEHVAGGNTSVFVFDGKSRLLYRLARAEYFDMLRELIPTGNSIDKRRVFRTTVATFLLCRLFLMTNPCVPDARRTLCVCDVLDTFCP